MSVGGIGGSGPVAEQQELDPSHGQVPVMEPAGPPLPDAAFDPVPANKDGSYDLSKLSRFSQDDGIPYTVGDQERCSCNSTVAALMAGGKEKLLSGIEGAKAEIQKKIDDPSMPQEGRLAWARELATLNQVEQKAKDNTLDTGDLNQLASTLYQTFSTTKGAGQMKKEDVAAMQRAVGLVPKNYNGFEDPITDSKFSVVGTRREDGRPDYDVAAIRSAQADAANVAFKQLKPGERAMVRVFNGAANDTGTPNHYVTIGKDRSGKMYVYDPLGKPDYVSGDAARTYLAGKAGIQNSEPYGEPGHRQQDVTVVLPMVKVK
jgi:hypothetical protein